MALLFMYAYVLVCVIVYSVVQMCLSVCLCNNVASVICAFVADYSYHTWSVTVQMYLTCLSVRPSVCTMQCCMYTYSTVYIYIQCYSVANQSMSLCSQEASYGPLTMQSILINDIIHWRSPPAYQPDHSITVQWIIHTCITSLLTFIIWYVSYLTFTLTIHYLLHADKFYCVS